MINFFLRSRCHQTGLRDKQITKSIFCKIFENFYIKLKQLCKIRLTNKHNKIRSIITIITKAKIVLNQVARSVFICPHTPKDNNFLSFGCNCFVHCSSVELPCSFHFFPSSFCFKTFEISCAATVSWIAK